MKKCSSVKLFLTELGKFEDKFQVNRINRTQVTNKLVDVMHFWTDYGNIGFACGIWNKLKTWSK